MNCKITLPQRDVRSGFARSLLFAGLFLISLLGAKQSSAQLTYTVGTGTSNNSYSPLYSCYVYNYCQTIYLQSELAAAGITGPCTINKIRWYNTVLAPSTNWNAWQIWMGNTAQASFSSNTNWVAPASLNQVFNGTVPAPTQVGWMEVTLSTPYVYSGTGNIVIATYENAPGYYCTAQWQSTPATGTRTMTYWSDPNNPNPMSPPAAVTLQSLFPNIQLDVTPSTACSGTPSTPVVAPAGPINSCAGSNVSLTSSGFPFASGLTFQWESATSCAGPWTPIAGATNTSYNFTVTGNNF